MSTRNLLLLLIPLVVAGVFLVGVAEKSGVSEMRGSSIDPQVALVITQFGKSMRYVTLTAPALDIRDSVAKYYAPYVTPELLSVWRANPRKVPGRSSSSPWPDRIEIHSVEPQGDGSYIVRGIVIEVTSSELVNGGIAGAYPVTMRLARHDKNWLIMQFEKGL
jgi:hypothetical protein